MIASHRHYSLISCCGIVGNYFLLSERPYDNSDRVLCNHQLPFGRWHINARMCDDGNRVEHLQTLSFHKSYTCVHPVPQPPA